MLNPLRIASLLLYILGLNLVFSEEIYQTTSFGENNVPSNCYAQAVYDELMKVIDIVKVNTYTENDDTERKTTSYQLKRFQEDEDYGVDGNLEIPSIVPMIFKLVGSAISLNSSGLVEGSFGLLPERVSSQITSVLGSLANRILGPGVIPTTTIRSPPRRRRRTTTTVASISESDIANSTVQSTVKMSTTESAAELNSTTSLYEINMTASTTTEGPSTTDVLFKESSLGELPVYAAAYAPNYVATTPYPVYANSYLHVLYPAPTTTTVPTTTPTSTTSTDPNSYAIALPFDYMEGIGANSGVSENVNDTVTDLGMPPNTTYPPLQQYTPPEYQETEYEYEEQTEEAKIDRYRVNTIALVPNSTFTNSGLLGVN